MLLKWMLVIAIVVPGATGDILNTLGMKRHGEVHDFRPGALGRMLAALTRNRYVLGGVVAMAISFMAFMSLLSVAELSFAVPATAASYLLETILAKYILKEEITRVRWVGACLVAIGVALLAY